MGGTVAPKTPRLLCLPLASPGGRAGVSLGEETGHLILEAGVSTHTGTKVGFCRPITRNTNLPAA